MHLDKQSKMKRDLLEQRCSECRGSHTLHQKKLYLGSSVLNCRGMWVWVVAVFTAVWLVTSVETFFMSVHFMSIVVLIIILISLWSSKY